MLDFALGRNTGVRRFHLGNFFFNLDGCDNLTTVPQYVVLPSSGVHTGDCAFLTACSYGCPWDRFWPMGMRFSN